MSLTPEQIESLRQKQGEEKEKAIWECAHQTGLTYTKILAQIMQPIKKDKTASFIPLTLEEIGQPNMDDIIKFWKMLGHQEETEMRVIDPGESDPKKKAQKFFFSNASVLDELVKTHHGKRNIYLGVNERKKGGTHQNEVIRIGIIPCDIDCAQHDRPATAEELREAKEVADQITADFVYKGYKKPTITFSGNGYQLFFCIPPISVDDGNRDSISEKIVSFGDELIKRYSTEKVKLDKVFDLARIMRLPGTVNLKSRTHSKIEFFNQEEDIKLRDDILNKEPEAKAIDRSYHEEKKIINGTGSSIDDLSVTSIWGTSGMSMVGGEYRGSHPAHGSTSGGNFNMNPSKNLWHCYRCQSGGGPLSAIAVKEGLIQCSEARAGNIRGNVAKEALRLAYDKYGLPKTAPTVLTPTGVKTKIILPAENKLISLFAEELAEVLQDKNYLFFRADSSDIIEVGHLVMKDEDGKDKESPIEGLKVINPHRFVTLIEKYIIPGRYVPDPITKKTKWVDRSIGVELAGVLLKSPILHERLPRIDRLFTVPIPILHKGDLCFPNRGYDSRFNSWLPYEAPQINTSLSLPEAKKNIEFIFKEFCFREEQDKIHAISALLTPFLRGIFKTFNTRTPVAFYKANRERSGKDYCAGITGILYEGFAMEESPISHGEHNLTDNNELRKKITSAMISGRKRLHFSNNKGHIDNAVFESITTAERYSDRLLGRNEILSFNNEIDFSLSGNLGISCTPDFANRCLFVNLFLAMEDANARRFENPDLHNWLREHRNLILSSLFTLVNNWVVQGKPSGKTQFSSFPEWARVCGGVLEAAGYPSPKAPDSKTLGVSGDNETKDMKVLFELCNALGREQWMTRSEIQGIIAHEDIFSHYNFGERSDSIKFGLQLSKFIGRVLSGIILEIENAGVRGSRQRFRFKKIEN